LVFRRAAEYFFTASRRGRSNAAIILKDRACRKSWRRHWKRGTNTTMNSGRIQINLSRWKNDDHRDDIIRRRNLNWKRWRARALLHAAGAGSDGGDRSAGRHFSTPGDPDAKGLDIGCRSSSPSCRRCRSWARCGQRSANVACRLSCESPAIRRAVWDYSADDRTIPFTMLLVTPGFRRCLLS